MFTYWYLILIVLFAHLLLSTTCNSIQDKYFKSCKLLKCSIWLIDGTVNGITPLNQSLSGNNSKEKVIRIPKKSNITQVSQLQGGTIKLSP